MSTAKDILQGYVHKLWDVLSPQASECLLNLPQDALTPEQRAVLAQYNRRFNNETQTSIHEDVPDENITLVDDEAEGSGAAEEPKKGRGRPRGSDSWGAVLRVQELNLDDWLVHHLRHNVDRNPSLFLSQQSINPQRSAHEDPMDALVATCLPARVFGLNEARNKILWLLSTLVVGDLGVKMFGAGVSIAKGKKFEDLRNAVGRRYDILQAEEKRSLAISSADELTSKVTNIVTMGDRLVFFCQQFSAGSLFFVSGTLTEFFLLNRFTRTGKAWDSAKNHLQSLQLQTKARESGADALGDALRAHLRDAYNSG